MSILKLVLFMCVLAIFFNAYRHYKGLAKKGTWQGYSAKGQFYTGIAFLFCQSSFYIDNITGIESLSLVFMVIYLFLLIYALKIEKAAKLESS